MYFGVKVFYYTSPADIVAIVLNYPFAELDYSLNQIKSCKTLSKLQCCQRISFCALFVYLSW